MAEAIQAYKPKCCNKAYMYKGSAIRHEKKCPHNVENHACQTCKHRIVDYETVYNRHHNGNPGSTDYDVLYWYCEVCEAKINFYPGAVEAYTKQIMPQMHCKSWEAKDGVEDGKSATQTDTE